MYIILDAEKILKENDLILHELNEGGTHLRTIDTGPPRETHRPRRTGKPVHTGISPISHRSDYVYFSESRVAHGALYSLGSL